MGFSFSHILLVLVVLLIVFGAGKLPRIMNDLAKGIRSFRDGMRDGDDETSNDNEIKHIESSKKKTVTKRK